MIYSFSHQYFIHVHVLLIRSPLLFSQLLGGSGTPENMEAEGVKIPGSLCTDLVVFSTPFSLKLIVKGILDVIMK